MMDEFDIEFPELQSIAPDLMFEEEPFLPIRNVAPPLDPLDREALFRLVLEDHPYAKPYPILSSVNNKSVTPRTILKLHPADYPAKRRYNKKNSFKHKTKGCEEDEIDVVTTDEPDDYVVRYDKLKASNGMNEVEAYLNSLWKDVYKDDEEKISRGSWSKEQARFFDAVYKLLNSYQLAKLAYTKNTNEPVLRKLSLDKATQRIRKAFGLVFWNPKHIVWLHGIMIDGLGSSLFLCYLEILQSLKRKVPTLFERVLLFDRGASEKELTAGIPNLGARLKKSWDPSTGLQTKVTMEKFPTIPFLIMVPSGPSIPHQSTKRNRFWNNQLMNFGKVFPISVPAYKTMEGYVIKHYLEHCISAIRSKITEFRNRFPERHVVLIGWGIGSLISCKVANLDKVDAIVCLGFPCNGIDGELSEDYWKGLAKIECPVLFLIGTHAISNSVTRTEKLRALMKTQTNLILIESADELLRLKKSQKKSLCMTQNMIDKLIQDEIYLFLKSVLFKPKITVSHPPKGPGPCKKRKKKVEGVEKVEAKRKKKSNVKVSLTTTRENRLPQAADVSVSSVSSVFHSNKFGLSTRGVIGNLSESLTTLPANVVTQNATIIGDNVIIHGKEINRNAVKEAKEKTGKKGKSWKKTAVQTNIGIVPGTQKFTANIGSQRAGNIVCQQLLPGDVRINKASIQQPVTFQKVPTGSFVLSGASGQVRLQGGANILYLQQATSVGTRLLQSPVITTSCGALNAVISSTMIGLNTSQVNIIPHTVISSNIIGSNPPHINIVPSSNFKFGPLLPTLSPHSKGISAIISSGNCGNLVFTSSQSFSSSESPSFQAKPVNNSISLGNTQLTSSIVSSTLSNDTNVTTATKVVSSNTLSTAVPSAIMTHLSANDLRYLASLIAKHSATNPNSPIQAAFSGASLDKGLVGEDKGFPQVTRDNIEMTKSSLSSSDAPMGTITSKSTLISILDRKVNSQPSSPIMKVSHPPSLAQRVAAIQQKDVCKVKNPRMKTPRITTSNARMALGHIITTNANKFSSLPLTSKVLHKVPVTLTIPISHLPPNLNFSSPSTLPRSVNIPVLSSYLSQEKFIVTSIKPCASTLLSRPVLTNPGVAKKSPTFVGQLAVRSTPGKSNNMHLFPSTRVINSTSHRMSVDGVSISKVPITAVIMPSKCAIRGKNPPITFHLAPQAALKDPKILRKAVSDVKVVGVLSQHSKPQISPLVNFAALHCLNNPVSPKGSLTGGNDNSVNMSAEELSPIQPRENVGSGKSITEVQKDKSAIPMRSSMPTVTGENVKSVAPLITPSSTLLGPSISTSINTLSRGMDGIQGGSVFLGKVGARFPSDSISGEMISVRDAYSTDTLPISANEDDSDVDFAVSPALEAAVPTSSTDIETCGELSKSSCSPSPNVVVSWHSFIDTNSTFVTSASFNDSTINSRSLADQVRVTSSAFDPKDYSCEMSVTMKEMREPKTSFNDQFTSIISMDSKLRFEPLINTSILSSKVTPTLLNNVKIAVEENGRKLAVDSVNKMGTTSIPLQQNYSASMLTASSPEDVNTVVTSCAFKAYDEEIQHHSAPLPSGVKFSSMEEKCELQKINASSINGATDSSTFNILPSNADTTPVTKVVNVVSKTGRRLDEFEMMIEEEPLPYITRSGRLMKSKYTIQYIDELDRKRSSKRRRLSSDNLDNVTLSKQLKIAGDASQVSTVTLESLVEAAKLIKNESNSFTNGVNVDMADLSSPSVTNDESTKHNYPIVDVDPTTNIAATAMLELLSGDVQSSKGNQNVSGAEKTNKEVADVIQHTYDPTSPSSEPKIFTDVQRKGNSHPSGAVSYYTSKDVSKSPNNVLYSNGRSYTFSSHSVIQNESPLSSAALPQELSIPKSDKIERRCTGGVPETSLPSLAPIQKKCGETSLIAFVNTEEVPIIEDLVNNRCDDRNENINWRDTSLPALAAIQDKYADDTSNFSADIVNVKHLPFGLKNGICPKESKIEVKSIVPPPVSISSLQKNKEVINSEVTNIDSKIILCTNVRENALLDKSEVDIPLVNSVTNEESDKLVLSKPIEPTSDSSILLLNKDSVMTSSKDTLNIRGVLSPLQAGNKSLMDASPPTSDLKNEMKEVVLSGTSKSSMAYIDSNRDFLPIPDPTSIPVLAAIQNKIHGPLRKLNEVAVKCDINPTPNHCVSYENRTLNSVNDTLPPLAAIPTLPTDNLYLPIAEKGVYSDQESDQLGTTAGNGKVSNDSTVTEDNAISPSLPLVDYEST